MKAGRPPRTALRRFFLPAVAFITGAEILAIEIVGARLISPQFGVSLYVWSALITVTLLALAVGYGLGGWLADRRAAVGDLFIIIAVAGLSLAAIPPLAPPVFSFCAGLGLRSGALVTALLLFSLPLACLAMVTPYVVKLLAAATAGPFERFGTVTGAVYALSTAGSVAGALLTGFILVPSIPLDRILQLLALVLLALAAGYWLAGGSVRARLAGAALLAGALFLQTVRFPVTVAVDPRFRTLTTVQSLYGELGVIELQGTRFLTINGILQGGLGRQGRPAFPYVPVIDELLRQWAPTARRVLVIGLGVGAIPQALERRLPAGPGSSPAVDVVELDPMVAQLARDYFGYEAGQSLTIDDGRRYLVGSARRYDAIVVDAYASETLPGHLLSLEAFELMRQRLSAGGVVVVNLMELDRPEASPARRAVTRTLRQVFPHGTAYRVDPAGRLRSQLLVGAVRSGPPNQPVIMVAMPAEPPFDGRMVTAHPEPFEADDGLRLTDSYNPLELLNLPAAEELRRANRAYLR